MDMKTKGRKNKDILEIISPTDALEILRQLSKKDKELKEKISKAALKFLCKVDTEEIANDVYQSLNGIDVEELWDRSGKKRYGYVDPVDEAFVMFEETIDPFMSEMAKFQELKLGEQAKTYAIGIIEGIRKFDSDSSSEFCDWAVDVPLEYLSTVVEEWKKGDPDKKDIDEIEALLR